MSWGVVGPDELPPWNAFLPSGCSPVGVEGGGGGPPPVLLASTIQTQPIRGWVNVISGIGIICSGTKELQLFASQNSGVSLGFSKPSFWYTRLLRGCCVFYFFLLSVACTGMWAHSDAATFESPIEWVKWSESVVWWMVFSLYWEWVIKPSNNTQSASMQAYKPHSCGAAQILCLEEETPHTYKCEFHEVK